MKIFSRPAIDLFVFNISFTEFFQLLYCLVSRSLHVLSVHVFFFASLNFYLIEISNFDWFCFISELASISDELLLPISRWESRIGETTDGWINWVMLMNSLCEYRSSWGETSNNNYAPKLLYFICFPPHFAINIYCTRGWMSFHERNWIEFCLFIDFSKISADLSVNGLKML